MIIDRSPSLIDEKTFDEAARVDPSISPLLSSLSFEAITYHSGDLEIPGLLVYPSSPGRYPCVIYNRGGAYESSLLPIDAATHLARIASWGYVVVASQYRGTPGYAGHDEFGGADVDDVLALIPLLDELPFADASRIGMWGWSRGGLMTWRALARTDRIAAAIVQSGIADAFDYMSRRPDMEEFWREIIPGFDDNREAELEKRSAIRWVDSLPMGTPILLVHGTADPRIDSSQSTRMTEALLASNRRARLALYENGDHHLSEHREEVYALAKEWLGGAVAGSR